ncbi:MAG: hypothetical protein PF483_16180 [Halothiobacillus sp.]|jgi:hypothetical protein|nr:hypothetical protein [Halothiobacillus sp.]
MSPDEFLTYLYDGGGLELQQQLYDVAFRGKLVVIPVAVTGGQGSGWFPSPLPDPGNDWQGRHLTQFDPPNQNDRAAMRQLASEKMIVRWPEPAGLIWREACKSVGAVVDIRRKDEQQGRSADITKPIDTKSNPQTFTPTRLTFGGFTPGATPQLMLLTGNIDAQEFNLPTADVYFSRLALAKHRGVDISNVPVNDIREIIEKAPYHYLSSWHQPLSYIELVINRSVWDGLSANKQNTLKLIAKNAVLTALTRRSNPQGAALKTLEANGAIHLHWPDSLLRVLRSVADKTLDDKALSLDSPDAAFDEGAAYRQVLKSQRDFIALQKQYSDIGDINQGLSRMPTSPGTSATSRQ